MTRAALPAAAAFLGGVMLQGLGGPAVPGVRVAAALVAVLYLVFSGARGGRLLLCLPLLAFFVLLPGPLPRGLAFALLVMAASPPELAGAGEGLFLAALATAFWGWIPGAEAFGDQVATWIGNRMQAPFAHPVSFGPSAAGLPAAAWALAMITARAIRSGTKAWIPATLAVAAGVAGQWKVAAWGGAHLSLPPAAGGPLELFSSLAWLLPMLALAVGIGFAGRGPEPSERPKRSFVPGAAFGLLLGTGAVLLLAGGSPQRRLPDRRLAVLNAGGLDWKRPVFDELGAFSGGMFGLLPAYLQRSGWQVEAIGVRDLAGFDRTRAQVLLLVNAPHEWTSGEREDLQEFVRAGGSVLVLGDHTDVFGLKRGFDSLLAPWGIRFAFDAAYHTGLGWQDDLEEKPVLPGILRDPEQAGIAIGASLEVESPARAWIQARYAHRDWGVRENVPGSFLGNYRYDGGPREKLGDLTLAAVRKLGRGRIVVFGDTSGFQNGSLDATFLPFVLPLLDSLARPCAFPLPPAGETLLAIFLLLGAAASIFLPRRPGVAALSAAAVVVFAWAGLGRAAPQPDPLPHAVLDHGLLFDFSHLPDVGHFDAGWNAVGSLQQNAERSGLFPYKMFAWDPAAVRNASVLALVAPRKPFSAAELEDVTRALIEGATVLVAASAPQAGIVNPLLSRFGLSVAPVSVGPIPPRGRQQETAPRFVDPSPIRVADGVETDALYSYGGEVFSVHIQVGGGHLIVIGDGRFFAEHNVEGLWGWWPGNIRFQHDLLETWCGGDSSRVRELLPPPEPPDE